MTIDEKKIKKFLNCVLFDRLNEKLSSQPAHTMYMNGLEFYHY